MDSQQKNYYQQFILGEASQASAEKVVPLVMSLLEPSSIVDWGCGTGIWLKTFQKYGISRMLGIDGEMMEGTAQFREDQFLKKDLTQAIELRSKFDLALCLEVAEHLPASAAETLINSLTRSSKKILFSAAIPHQAGTGHIHLQWPSFWADLFARKGFVPLDIIRKLIWSDPKVAYYYRQNIILYVANSELENFSAKQIDSPVEQPSSLDIVHPEMLANLIEQCNTQIQSLEDRISFLEDEALNIRKTMANLWSGVKRKLRIF